MEKKLRAKLEEEVKELRGALAAQKLASLSGDDVLDADDPMLSGLGGRASASLVSAESLEDLRRKFSEAEEKVGLEEWMKMKSHNQPLLAKGDVQRYTLEHN